MKTPSVLIHPLSGNFIAWFFAAVCCATTTYVNGAHAWLDGPEPILIGLLVAGFWSTHIHAFREAVRIEDFKKTINHRSRFVVRGIIALLIGGSLHIFAEGWVVSAYIRSVACAIYLGGIFWLNFDFLLNHDRGKDLFYVSEWYKTAWIDRWWRKRGYSPLLWLLTKIVVFIITFMLYNRTLGL